MKNRKYFVALFLAVAFILIPVFATAQKTPTIAELQAQIADLQRQLAILLGQQDNTGTWCHTFNTNLSIGMSGSEVTALQTVLTKSGFTVSATGNYGESTAAAVSGFQLRYRSEILTPNNLAAPTGYFGPSTRAVMNRLYGCENNAVVPPPAAARYTLTTAITGVLGFGSGTITKSPNQTSYAAGDVVTLTATPTVGSTFVGWSGNLTHLTSPATITMNGDKTVTAIFTTGTTISTPSLIVTSPSNNQQWTVTNGPVIQWSSANIPAGNQIMVELLTPTNGSVPGFTSFTTANDSSESGRLANSTVPSGSYYFRLKTIVNSQTVYGGSGVFQFTGASQPAPTVTLRGFQLRVTDQTTSASLAGVTITINRGGTYVATQTTGSDGWTPAISLRVGESHTFSFSKAGYRAISPIILTILSGTNVYIYGPVRLEAETVVPPPPTAASITVTSPSSNSSWTSTNGPVIQWSSANIPAGNQIMVELLTPTNGSVPGFTSFTTANDSSESGRLTNSSVASGWYYFRLSTVVNGQTIYGGSGVFQFTGVSTPPPTSTCGNGVLDSGEQCDGTNFGGLSCSSYGYITGNLSCSASCTLSTSQCTNPPPTNASITVTSPPVSPTVTYIVTNGPVIQWSSANIPAGQTITVELLTPSNGQVSGFSTFTTANDGSESGRLTNSTVPSGSYYFRLKTTVNGQTIYGGSGVFQFNR